MKGVNLSIVLCSNSCRCMFLRLGVSDEFITMAESSNNSNEISGMDECVIHCVDFMSPSIKFSFICNEFMTVIDLLCCDA